MESVCSDVASAGSSLLLGAPSIDMDRGARHCRRHVRTSVVFHVGHTIPWQTIPSSTVPAESDSVRPRRGGGWRRRGRSIRSIGRMRPRPAAPPPLVGRSTFRPGCWVRPPAPGWGTFWGTAAWGTAVWGPAWGTAWGAAWGTGRPLRRRGRRRPRAGRVLPARGAA